MLSCLLFVSPPPLPPWPSTPPLALHLVPTCASHTAPAAAEGGAALTLGTVRTPCLRPRIATRKSPEEPGGACSSGTSPVGCEWPADPCFPIRSPKSTIFLNIIHLDISLLRISKHHLHTKDVKSFIFFVSRSRKEYLLPHPHPLGTGPARRSPGVIMCWYFRLTDVWGREQ